MKKAKQKKEEKKPDYGLASSLMELWDNKYDERWDDY